IALRTERVDREEAIDTGPTRPTGSPAFHCGTGGRRAAMRRLRAWSAATAMAVAIVMTSAAAVAVPAGTRRAAPIGYAGPARAVIRHPSKPDATQQFTSRNWGGYITYASTH